MNYFDSSAILKLIFKEKESLALAKALPNNLVTSTLGKLEVIRTTKLANSNLLPAAHEVLSKFMYIQMDENILRTVELFDETIKLRTLDSIHLASALSLMGKLEAIYTYDNPMITQAKNFGIEVKSPA